jgi:hypothetical protein
LDLSSDDVGGKSRDDPQFALFWERMGCDDGPMITIWDQDRREYQQNTFRQTPTAQKWRHLFRSGAIETACCTKHDGGQNV